MIFTESHETYEYRRVKFEMMKTSVRVSEKVIRRLMKEMNLTVKQSPHAKYSFYKGESTPAVENLVNWNLKATHPNEKWVTVITEFGLPDGKVYLSPVSDCFDGMPVAWTIGTLPDSNLVNTMLDRTIATLSTENKPIVHSYRECHYHWPGWILRMKDTGLTHSM